MIKRLLAALVGVVLLLIPALFFFTVLVPVEQYRQGTWADFSGALASTATLYGGAAMGVFTIWLRTVDGRITAGNVFRASFWGGVVAIGVVIGVQSLYGWLTSEFESAGNLWGLIPIFGAAFSALIACGVGMVWYGLRTLDQAKS